jgi:hypothetical protein
MSSGEPAAPATPALVRLAVAGRSRKTSLVRAQAAARRPRQHLPLFLSGMASSHASMIRPVTSHANPLIVRAGTPAGATSLSRHPRISSTPRICGPEVQRIFPPCHRARKPVRFRWACLFTTLRSLVETNCCFQHEEDIVAGAFDLSNRGRDSFESESYSLIAFPSSASTASIAHPS